MVRDDILKLSREENEGRHDERERFAFGAASRVGMLTGAIVCTVLAWAGGFLFRSPEVSLAGWLVYCAMQGSANLALYRDLQKRRDLVWGIIEISFAAVLAAALALCASGAI